MQISFQPSFGALLKMEAKDRENNVLINTDDIKKITRDKDGTLTLVTSLDKYKLTSQRAHVLIDTIKLAERVKEDPAKEVPFLTLLCLVCCISYEQNLML